MRKLSRGRARYPVTMVLAGTVLVLAAPPAQAVRSVGALPFAVPLAVPVAVPVAVPKVTVGGELLKGRGLIVAPGVKAPPKTGASSFVIADADTGQVLAAKDPHGFYRPASTLKILTAVTLIGGLDKNKKIKPSDAACNAEGSAVGLKPLPIYTVDQLFQALLLVSGNDAAIALAEANGGVPNTLKDMNAQARRLQAYDTVAKTPNGLDKPGQRSSAYDLALIARAGLAKSDFRRYVSMKLADFPAPKGKTYEIQNHNKLLWRYKGMLGVKNGWTSEALGSFVGAAKRDGHTIIVSIMHHDGSFWNEVADLLDWGFAARGKVAPVGQLVGPAPTPTPTPPKPLTLPGQAKRATGTPEDSGVAPVVVGAGLLAGVTWVAFGLRRRRKRRSH